MKIKTRETREGKIKHKELLVLYKVLPKCSLLDKINRLPKKCPPKISILFNMAWEQACHSLMNLKIILNLKNLSKFNVFTQSLIACLRQKLFPCLTFDLESGKLEIELHIRTLTDLANQALEKINLMTRNRPTVGPSIRQFVCSCTDYHSAQFKSLNSAQVYNNGVC